MGEAKGSRKPRVGILACNSFSSNSGAIAGLAAEKVAKEFDWVGILSLPALANGVPRQVRLFKRMDSVIVLDGCKNSCASKVAQRLGVTPKGSLNLESDLSIVKLGPFTTLSYGDEDLERAASALRSIVLRVRRGA